MKILQMISGGESGGSKKHLLTLVSEMGKRNIKTIIVCFIEGELYREAKSRGLDIRLIKQNKRFDLSIINELKDLCIREDINLINSHGGRANFICYFLRKKVNITFITTIHSDYESDYKGSYYKTFIYTKINKLALKSFDYYIAVSESFKKLLINRGFNRNKIFTVYNGIDTKIEKSTLTKEEIIKKYSLPRFTRYISMVARLHPIKGHKNFLDACEKVQKDLSDTGILLVGDGEIKEELQNHIKDYKINKNVVFLGYQSPDDFFKISDFTILTSYSESFPLVILESGLYGKTVLASNVGGIPEIIKDKENGILINPKNIDDISIKLREMLNNEDFKTFGAKLREDILKKFSIEALGDSYKKILEACIKEE